MHISLRVRFVNETAVARFREARDRISELARDQEWNAELREIQELINQAGAGLGVGRDAGRDETGGH